MTLLDFARGPALKWSLTIMVFGIVWRLVGILLQTRSGDLSKPRGGAWSGGAKAVITRSLPAVELEHAVRFQHLTGYGWHIGLFVTVLFFEPHIAFFADILGFGWPGLPNNAAIIAGAITLALLITLLIRRITHPVLRMISTADDYIALFVVIAPLLTGILAYAHLGLRYEQMLALHILSVELMFVWVPFGKLMHTFMWVPSRAQIGSFFQRRGVKA